MPLLGLGNKSMSHVCVFDALLRGDNSKTRLQHHYEALRLCLNARYLCGDHVNRSPHQVEERSLKAVGLTFVQVLNHSCMLARFLFVLYRSICSSLL